MAPFTNQSPSPQSFGLCWRRGRMIGTTFKRYTTSPVCRLLNRFGTVYCEVGLSMFRRTDVNRCPVFRNSQNRCLRYCEPMLELPDESPADGATRSPSRGSRIRNRPHRGEIETPENRLGNALANQSDAAEDIVEELPPVNCIARASEAQTSSSVQLLSTHRVGDRKQTGHERHAIGSQPYLPFSYQEIDTYLPAQLCFRTKQRNWLSSGDLGTCSCPACSPAMCSFYHGELTCQPNREIIAYKRAMHYKTQPQIS